MKILAYGSLMRRDSLVRLLGRDASLERVSVSDYSRTFNAPFFGYSYFNLVYKPGSHMEGAFFEINEIELEKFSEREAGSELLEVAPGLMAFVWPEAATKELAVLQSYIDFCSKAAEELDINLDSGLIMPKVVIDDRNDPKYPDAGQ